MLVLLPPSETKAPGGDGPPLELGQLSYPELTPQRRVMVDALVELASDVPASMAALGLSKRQSHEVARNTALWSGPTLPAVHRYTGVLYDALGAGGFTTPQLARARRRVAIASALFGLIRAGDRVPAYRLSGTSTMPSVGTPRRMWRPALDPVLAGIPGLVVDLRSGPYAALGTAPGAVTVRVVTEDGDGRRRTVSHHNKAYKGRVAATLATASREPSTVDGLARLLSRAGMAIQRSADRELELLTG